MNNKNKGFTLVELILVIALLGIIIPLIYSVFFSGQKSFEVGVEEANEQADNRLMRDYLTKELRYISDFYNTAPDTGEYSTMQIIDNKDKQLEILDSNGDAKVIPTKFNELEMTIDEGILSITLIPLNSDKEYKFTILLENYSNKDNLQDGPLITTKDSDKSISYFSYK